MSKPFLSKSKYLAGLQCPKLLWHHYNAKDKLPEVDEDTQAMFDQGHEVGELAKKLFPDGIDVDWDVGFEEVLRQSRESLAKRKPLFEAGFMSGRTYARADILEPVGRNQWDIIEVKMGSYVKPINIEDVAFQRFCYEGAGVPIRKCWLMHINTAYVRQGEINPGELFVREDITDALAAQSDVQTRVAGMLASIQAKACPPTDIGPYCDDPYDCPLMSLCWVKVWKHENNVFTLPNARGRQWKLYKKGILRNEDIPDDFDLTAQQRIQVQAERTGEPHIDRSEVSKFLKQLVPPIHFMDFEAFGFDLPIPLLDNTHPYGQVPFQFSVHVAPSLKAEPGHISWLWDGDGAPWSPFLKHLRAALGDKGSIVVFNKGFESTRLQESAALCPEYAAWVESVYPRIVDLRDIFRNFAVYYPSQHGSGSIKAILPAMTGHGYEDMEVSDGGQAASEFVRVTFGDVDAKDRKRVGKKLEEYCGLDTMGMVEILKALSLGNAG